MFRIHTPPWWLVILHTYHSPSYYTVHLLVHSRFSAAHKGPHPVKFDLGSVWYSPPSAVTNQASEMIDLKYVLIDRQLPRLMRACIGTPNFASQVAVAPRSAAGAYSSLSTPHSAIMSPTSPLTLSRNSTPYGFLELINKNDIP